MEIELMIIGFLAGEADEHERLRLAEWREADPANETEFQRISRFWTAIEDLVWPSDGDSIPPVRRIIDIAESRWGGPTARSITVVESGSECWRGVVAAILGMSRKLRARVGSIGGGVGWPRSPTVTQLDREMPGASGTAARENRSRRLRSSGAGDPK